MLTLAPGVTLWDAGEFLAAIRTLGIPHPPGTPLYVLLGRVWSLAFGDLFGFARSINLLSAVCTALGCGILASLFAKWTGDSFAGTAAGITAGLMSTVWLSATETETLRADGEIVRDMFLLPLPSGSSSSPQTALKTSCPQNFSGRLYRAASPFSNGSYSNSIFGTVLKSSSI